MFRLALTLKTAYGGEEDKAAKVRRYEAFLNDMGETSRDQTKVLFSVY